MNSLKFYLGIVLLLGYNIEHITCSYQVLQSPRATNYGAWGHWEQCRPGALVVGMSLKVQRYVADYYMDNTALNGIKFFCARPGEALNLNNFTTSSMGPWGNWGNIYKCPGPQDFVVGFQLKSAPALGRGKGSAYDDTGAGNLRIICGPHISTVMDGDGNNELGTWTTPQRCPPKQAICAIRTQVEKTMATGDNSSLNNVEALCCPLPEEKKQETTTVDFSG